MVTLIIGSAAEIEDLRSRCPALFPDTKPREVVSGNKIVRLWSDEHARRFRSELYGAMDRLIEALLKSSGGKALNQEQALKVCGWKTMHELSGTLSGITRAAQRATGDKRAFAIKARYNGLRWTYSLVPELAEALNKA
jgi:hypothetical protein